MIITQKINNKCDKILSQQLAVTGHADNVTAILRLNVPNNMSPVPLANQFTTRNGWRRALITRKKVHIEEHCGEFLNELERNGLFTGIRISKLVVITGPAYLIVKYIESDVVEIAMGDQRL